MMAMDTPAKIAIVGAGPIGLEAALYARFLGYDVEVFEQGDVGESLGNDRHLPLFTPFAMNRSTLGLAAIYAQDPDWQPPDDKTLLTRHEFLEEYVLPLSTTDLLDGQIRERTEVLAIGRQWHLKGDLPDDEARGDDEFRLLVRDRQGTQRVVSADVVIDASGVRTRHNWLGQGGIPAIGEAAAAEGIDYRVPDIAGNERARFAGRHTLVVGGGCAAATSIVALAELARAEPRTRVTWVTRREQESGEGAIRAFKDDPLNERARLIEAANAIAREGGEAIVHRPETMVEGIERRGEGGFHVQLAGRTAERIDVDGIVANVGYRPQRELYRELHVHECYATESPMKLAAALRKDDSPVPGSYGAEVLIQPEPHFYIIGAKSFGRDRRFTIATGLEQIRDLFTVIGDRADLDLYANMSKTLPKRN